MIPTTTRDLTIAQRWLVRIMSEYQFGRIENLRVEQGQPAPDHQVSIVRAARFGSKDGGLKVPASDNPELKQTVRDLFDEIERLQNGVIVRLEFKHGLPFLLETVTSKSTIPGDAQRDSSK
ncbi:MAG: hypothetical protein ABSG41_11660 [Bryobacteraceae bacterium]